MTTLLRRRRLAKKLQQYFERKATFLFKKKKRSFPLRVLGWQTVFFFFLLWTVGLFIWLRECCLGISNLWTSAKAASLETHVQGTPARLPEDAYVFLGEALVQYGVHWLAFNIFISQRVWAVVIEDALSCHV